MGLLAALDFGELGAEIIDDGLAKEIPDLDGALSGSAQPVAVGAEEEAVDDITGLKGVEVLGLVQVPEHDSAVLTSGSAESTIGGDGNGVDVTAVANVVDIEGGGVGLQVPNLNHLVPTGRDNHGLGAIGREADSRDPLGVTQVATARSGDGKVTLQLTADVPQLDGLVAGTRDDEAVVRAEGGRHDVTSVAVESGLSLAGGQVPQAHGLVPRAGQSKATILAEGNVADEVVVSVEGLLGNTKVLAVSGQIPDNSRLV